MQIIERQPEPTYSTYSLPLTCAGSNSPGKDMPTKTAPDPPKQQPKKK